MNNQTPSEEKCIYRAALDLERAGKGAVLNFKWRDLCEQCNGSRKNGERLDCGEYKPRQLPWE